VRRHVLDAHGLEEAVEDDAVGGPVVGKDRRDNQDRWGEPGALATGGSAKQLALPPVANAPGSPRSGRRPAATSKRPNLPPRITGYWKGSQGTSWIRPAGSNQEWPLWPLCPLASLFVRHPIQFLILSLTCSQRVGAGSLKTAGPHSTRLTRLSLSKQTRTSVSSLTQ
jgi:hypothetical protein